MFFFPFVVRRELEAEAAALAINEKAAAGEVCTALNFFVHLATM